MTPVYPLPPWQDAQQVMAASLGAQGDVLGSLQQAVSDDRLSHAVLLQAEQGLGKRILALALAMGLLCRNRQSLGHGQPPDATFAGESNGGLKWFGACQSCIACRRLLASNSPALTWLNPQRSSIGIEQVKEFLDDLRLSYDDGYRCYVIDGAERLTPQAANLLLKRLEEPPSGVVFILLANQLSSLLPTIISRCQVFRLRTLPEKTVIHLLTAGGGISRQAATVFARLAKGNPGAAWELAHSEDLAAWRKLALDAVKNLTSDDEWQVFEYANRYKDKQAGRDDLKAALDLLQVVYRDLLLLQLHPGAGPGLVNQDELASLKQLASADQQADWGAAASLVEEAKRSLTSNANAQLVLEVLMSELQQVTAQAGAMASG